MLLADVREYLKTKIECPQWYIGKIDGAKEQCIGIYNVQGPTPNIALGGLVNTSYSTKAISILVHWGKNADVAERKAQEIYSVFFGQVATIGGKRIVKFDMRTSEPIGVGTDSNGIYEYVIETVIYYER
ncbi:minor capsid protein [Clostridium algidicarnis]|uniref:minor capsid protein n=1 Tax=Clostridium algidicarnis TaxID=37659 RepID=UPI001C0D5F30|nr:minor capsid protein [Clostridium algidicarnis]MBU3208690.1 minor capsid protein [Clostridium algidicarnis]